MVRPNIGIINAMIRITFGLTLLCFSTAKMVRKPWRDGNWMMIMLASMKVAEGIVRYCPVVAMMEETKNNQQDKEDEESTFNPS
ncbi:hypothetical protein N780_10190 [Pontibacillus chungwhensis BH030062]|uniref:Inner membrane protein YgaP-like transmembrane domain-containing protein n=1 Tax=Pontibacillus chungwhensis BH030062 TaxID=1385513 RepID=A0A0A2UT59_9BACI|nr:MULTISPECIES: DUF2892 domain-containing protein [Pontibacillus]KGP89686.1 hypothetical protein N780_10190 [Pontibacillus chungwhensis BH030062]QST00375.1 DUF2892 domain-containing protein [Pontibacillus sp. ALD_SL1]